VQGNINLIEAAVRHGVKKFVLVTSIGTGEQPPCNECGMCSISMYHQLAQAFAGDSKAATPAHVYEVLKPVLLEKEKAEERLKVESVRDVQLSDNVPCFNTFVSGPLSDSVTVRPGRNLARKSTLSLFVREDLRASHPPGMGY
jgi:hypothetical protein